MTTERIDTVENYFNRLTRMSKISNILFWMSVICSFAVFFTSNNVGINSTMNIIFILITILYFTFSNWVSIFLLREAQNKRRTHLLSNSLGVRLDDEETNLYYNNPQSPSLLRLGMNVFENSLFTCRVTEEMAKWERIKVFVYIIIWLLLLLFRETNLNLLSIVAQTIFTTGILVTWIRLEVLRYSSNQIFNELRQVFLANGLKGNRKSNSLILSLVFRYETTVASMGIHLSSRVFHRINSSVSEEWEKIKKNIDL
ncbi:hypothetical protein [Fredinandcohnia quinoae]|uniref:Uncharacterized protein n=1 Tax=Fredinandcohnia quinoae TaxID=2918902 RepID=A0AAW5E4D5_9BACI|nr:hypothetical protein [Fredinandcohnia sp. SECRCQ15]MCH1627208.1 hypothetical protein [Fredinandcohnia sp. SECRCQ15]